MFYYQPFILHHQWFNCYNSHLTETSVKRRRGRPRKVPLSENIQNPGSTPARLTTNVQSKLNTQARHPKKRGRKRKVKVDSEDYDSEMEERESQEKSRVWEQVQPQFLTLVIDALDYLLTLFCK